LLLFALFASFCHFFGTTRVVGQCRNVWGTDLDHQVVKKLAKKNINGKKQQILGTGLNLVVALHLALNVINVPQNIPPKI